MSTPNVRDILSVPGKLYINPSGLTSPANYGTPLGIVHDVEVITDVPTAYITAEEYAGERVEGQMVGAGCAIGFILRGWDKNAIQQLYPNTVAGTVTGKRYVQSPGTIRPGEPLSNRSVVLLFAPDDPDRHMMFLMRRALPAIEANAKLAMRLDQEFGIPALFYGIRDTSSRMYLWGLPHDLQVVF